jgi:hypothetical protein
MRLESHLEVDELERRYRAAKEPHERSRWQILSLLVKGQTAAAVAESTGYSRFWIGKLVRRYNAQGPEAMRNRQYTHSRPGSEPPAHPACLYFGGRRLAHVGWLYSVDAECVIPLGSNRYGGASGLPRSLGATRVRAYLGEL